MDPTSKQEGHCDLIAHTVLLYVLLFLTYMYCTLYVLNIGPYSLEQVDDG